MSWYGGHCGFADYMAEIATTLPEDHFTAPGPGFVTVPLDAIRDIIDALDGKLDMHDEATLRADLSNLLTGEG